MTLNFKKMCRLCMDDTTDVLPIYEEIGPRDSRIRLLKKLTSIKMSKNDGLPANVCISCLDEINNILAFKERCERSDEKLRDYLKSSLKEKASRIKQLFEIVDCDALEENNESKTEDTEAEKIIGKDDSFLIQADLPELPSHDAADNIEETVRPVAAHARFVRPKAAILTLPQAEHKCKNCGAGFVELRTLNIHEKSEVCLKFRYTCEECDCVFDEEKFLLSHQKEVHEAAKNKCNICGKQFEKNTQLYFHMKYHQQAKKHQCPECKKSFRLVSALNDHMRAHSGERPFLCSICGSSFKQNTNLVLHMMRHNNTKPFKCTTCNCSFVTKAELKVHTRKHTGAQPYVCAICGTKFKRKDSMVNHQRIHTGVKKYACEFCPLRFTSSGTLINHRRTHTGERPYECKFCPRSFAQRSDWISHTRIHTGERPYACDKCDMSFLQKGSLKLHQKKIHENSGTTSTAAPIQSNNSISK